jgi:hypothetical protein
MGDRLSFGWEVGIDVLLKDLHRTYSTRERPVVDLPAKAAS